jgi:hypothetical protein
MDWAEKRSGWKCIGVYGNDEENQLGSIWRMN